MWAGGGSVSYPIWERRRRLRPNQATIKIFYSTGDGKMDGEEEEEDEEEEALLPLCMGLCCGTGKGGMRMKGKKTV